MPHEQELLIAEAQVFLAEFCGSGVPFQPLMRTGRFSDGWPERYLAFVKRVSACYGEANSIPREIVAVVYMASVYCTKRYFDWQRFTGGTDEASERLVDQVRWAADHLIMDRYWKDGGPGR